MWVEQAGLTQIDANVRRGGSAEVDRLLREVLFSPASRIAVPVCCPTCRRDLVRQPLAIAELFVSGCPDGHGAWLSPDVAEPLRRLVGARAAAMRRRRVIALTGLTAVSLVLLAMLTTPSGQQTAATVTREVEDRVENARLTEEHWPERRWPGARAIPLKASRIDTHEELVYFDQLLQVLEAGISNRLNMEGVLAVRRTPERYVALYEIYRQRQGDVLDRLRHLPVPARLQPIHEQILWATERQIVFYGDFAQAKAKDPATDLRGLLGHPALREQNQALLDAWGRVRQLYPDLDTATHEAIYYHLCGFDTV